MRITAGPARSDVRERFERYERSGPDLKGLLTEDQIDP